MKCIHSEKSGAMYMSDGYLTLAILRNRGEAAPSGINHFGFQVEDLEDIEQKLQKWEEPMTGRPSTRPFAEHRAMDPDGNLFDISVHGYDHVELPKTAPRRKRLEEGPRLKAATRLARAEYVAACAYYRTEHRHRAAPFGQRACG